MSGQRTRGQRTGTPGSALAVRHAKAELESLRSENVLLRFVCEEQRATMTTSASIHRNMARERRALAVILERIAAEVASLGGQSQAEVLVVWAAAQVAQADVLEMIV